MSQSDGADLPQVTRWDHLHTAAKAALSTIPLVGGPAAEFFSSIITPPLSRRRDEWFQSLAEKISVLSDRVDGFTAESLAQNDAFVSATLHATRIALQTHQKEKLDMLRNALLNVALGRAPEEDEQAIFLAYVEALTVWHIRLLEFFNAPTRVAESRGASVDYSFGSLSRVLENIYPELRGRGEFYGQIARDLRARGLLDSPDNVFHVTMSGSGLTAKRTTGFADRFLAFLVTPREIDG